MRIANILNFSMKDYPKKNSVVVFTPTCNYQCGYCHAKLLLKNIENINEKNFFDYLDSKKGWIDGVVLCGGEPTLQPDLENFTKKIKEKGYLVKLDTNGSNPSVLAKLKNRNLIDYIAMDVKGPKNLYSKIIGKDIVGLEDAISRSITLTTYFPDYEFRTTVGPVIRTENEISFMTPEEIKEIAKWIVNMTGSNEHKYYLQPFVPKKGELLDSRLERFPRTPKELLEEIKEEVIKYLPRCDVR